MPRSISRIPTALAAATFNPEDTQLSTHQQNSTHLDCNMASLSIIMAMWYPTNVFIPHSVPVRLLLTVTHDITSDIASYTCRCHFSSLCIVMTDSEPSLLDLLRRKFGAEQTWAAMWDVCRWKQFGSSVCTKLCKINSQRISKKRELDSITRGALMLTLIVRGDEC